MIDIENKIFTTIKQGILSKHSTAKVKSEYEENPAEFPFISIVEADNYIVQEQKTTDTIEEFARLMYEINIYSDKVSGKKQEVKEIANTIDGVLTPMNFTRTYKSYVPNIDRTIKRMVLRYEVICSKGEENGTNTDYTLYTI